MPALPTNRSRWTAYASISVALAGGVVLKALCQRPNFYSAAVYLSQSSANLMILCNLVFVTACSFLFFLGRLLFGTLRPIEVEQLYEKGWFAVTELCLAMTIFRGEIGAWFGIMFFSLLAGKVWGWIGEGRVEVLEQQPPRNPRLFHTRLALSLSLSVLFNVTMLEYVVDQVLHMARPDMMVMFGFEFAVLSITSLSTATRYALNLIEIGIVRGQKQKRIEAIQKDRIDAALRELHNRQGAADSNATAHLQAPTPTSPTTEETARLMQEAASQPIDEADVEVEGWEAKGRWVFYLDLATDFLKLVVYISFFFILLVFYGLPLHIMRDVFLTCRSFVKRIGDFMRYRTATRDMHERYPDATEAEIGREDVCIICREDMRPYVPPAQGEPTNPVAERMRPKKLPCGHVLHFSCLRSWLERQQICPTCRATVVPTAPTQTATAVNPDQGAAGLGQQRGGQPARNGPRVYQLGPLRIGVGAARGNNMFEELEQQLANPNPAPNQNQAGNAPQQYGFGIRWDGMRRRREHRSARGTAQEQIDAVERQIQRELDQLRTSTHELQALRNIQAQLNRFRMSRQGNPAQQAQPSSAAQQRVTLPATVLSSNPQQSLLHAGSDQLPPGLTLPEGWSMMPLQPHAPATLFPAAQFNATSAVPNMTSLQRTPNQHTPINAAVQAQPQPHARPVHAALMTSQFRPQPQAPSGQPTLTNAAPSAQSQPSRPSVTDQHHEIHQRAHQLAHERAFREAHQGLNPHSMTTVTVNGDTHSHTHSPAPIRPDRSIRHANLGSPEVSGNPIQQALAALPQQVQDAIASRARSASEHQTASQTTHPADEHVDDSEASTHASLSNHRPLPNWDSSIDDTASSAERQSSINNDSVQRNGGSGATPTPEREDGQQVKKHATVEDLVEDPD